MNAYFSGALLSHLAGSETVIIDHGSIATANIVSVPARQQMLFVHCGQTIMTLAVFMLIPAPASLQCIQRGLCENIKAMRLDAIDQQTPRP